ncbi:Beta-xylosidase [Lachnospiraceae bacterium C7]|nr:Beta-xylosidase [Lachnospiraceae bacterium C7]
MKNSSFNSSLKKSALILATTATVLASQVAYAPTQVFADDDAAEGLSVKITTDKKDYSSGEEASISINASNNSSYDFQNITYKLTLPEGIMMSSGGKTEGVISTLPALDHNEMTFTTGKLPHYEADKSSSDSSNKSGDNKSGDSSKSKSDSSKDASGDSNTNSKANQGKSSDTEAEGSRSTNSDYDNGSEKSASSNDTNNSQSNQFNKNDGNNGKAAGSKANTSVAKNDNKNNLKKADKVSKNPLTKDLNDSTSLFLLGALALALTLIGLYAFICKLKHRDLKDSFKGGIGLFLSLVLFFSILSDTNLLTLVSARDSEYYRNNTDPYSYVEGKCDITVDGVPETISVTLKVPDKGVVKKDFGIHDPSIFEDPESGRFYSYGSHIANAMSTDLVSWTEINNSSKAYEKENTLFVHNYKEEFKEVYDWFGPQSKEGIWAPDITYSKEAKEAGNDPYLMYVTVCNGGYKAAICLATAKKPEGPFSYKGMIVCSDYRESDVRNGYTNVLDVLGAKSVDELPSNLKNYYMTKTSGDYKNKLPDCIDPSPVRDKDGNLYMVYGSFTCHGGLHLLKLDPKTGLRSNDNYPFDPNKGEDPYYGKKIANANGEGPYILRVDTNMSPTGAYYFLFWSQGNLRSTGGYNMRLFRSEYIDHGYVDYAGNSAMKNMNSTNQGLRIMDGYKFSDDKYPSTANGGNSAIVTSDGKILVHYHSKSCDNSAYGKDGFIIKSNEMFLNEDGWLVTSPDTYNGETADSMKLSKDDIAGDYEFIYHRLQFYKDPVNYNDNFVESKVITLNADGTVTGAINGTWSAKEDKDGKQQINVSFDGNTFKGVAFKAKEGLEGISCPSDNETDENGNERVVFTAAGKNNRCIWGKKVKDSNDERINKDLESINIPSEIKFENSDKEIVLPTKGNLGSKFTWKSNSKAFEIKSENNSVKGKAIPQLEDTEVILTATGELYGKSISKDFKVTIGKEVINIPKITSSPTIDLPKTTKAGLKITWSSSNENVINSATGKVTLPEAEAAAVDVTLTARIEDAGNEGAGNEGEGNTGIGKTYTYVVKVMPLPSEKVYEENFSTFNADSDLKAGKLSSNWISPNLQNGLKLVTEKDNRKAIEFATGQNNTRGAYGIFNTTSKINGNYSLEFDMRLKAGNNQGSQFVVTCDNVAYNSKNVNYGVASGYLFKLDTVASDTWTINGKDKVKIPSGKWVHVKAIVNTSSNTVALKISNGNSVLYDGSVMTSNASTSSLQGIYFQGGRYQFSGAVCNIVIKK